MSHTINEKKNLLLRAKRIRGQVDALVRALDEERDCSEVLQVMSAARGAMNSLMAELLEGHIRSHVLNGKQKPTSRQVAAADEVIDMVIADQSGSAFGSNSTLGNPRNTAASIMGPAAYPPTPSAAANRCLRRIANESHIAGASFAVLRASLIPPMPFSPAERMVSSG